MICLIVGMILGLSVVVLVNGTFQLIEYIEFRDLAKKHGEEEAYEILRRWR